MRFQIFGNAFVLVILTTVLCGFVINWLIPGIPIAEALALAAILPPESSTPLSGSTRKHCGLRCWMQNVLKYAECMRPVK